MPSPKSRRAELGPVAAFETGPTRCGLPVQQFENATEQFAPLQRRGDEFVAIGAVPTPPLAGIAGEQRLEPGPGAPAPDAAWPASRGSRAARRPQRSAQTALPGEPECREPLGGCSDWKTLLGQYSRNPFSPHRLMVDDKNRMGFRIHKSAPNRDHFNSSGIP